MKSISKICCVFAIFFGLALLAYADRGKLVRKDHKPHMNIDTYGTLKNSIAFNLHSGLKYKGSETIRTQRVGNILISESIVTYQKGNTIYLIPYKQKIATPHYTQQDGYKLILRSR